MKVKSIEVSQFKNFEKFGISLNQDVTYLVGPNGAGKSGIGIDALWFILRGIGEKGVVLNGERRLFLKDGRQAEGTMVMTDGENDWTIKRTVTPTTQKLEITAPDGSKLDQSFIESFWNSELLNPISFANLDPREQCKVLGIDTSALDSRIKELKEDFTIINRELKAFGEIELPEHVEPVDFSSLSRQKDEILAFNREQEQKARAKNEIRERIKSLDQQISDMETRLAAMKASRDGLVNDYASSSEILPSKSTQEIDAQIAAASETNAKAQLYRNAVKRLQDKEAKAIELKQNQRYQEDAKADKTEYLQKLELPYANLTVSDEGWLLFDGRPIREHMFSKGQLIKLAVRLLGNKDREFKYCYLEDFSLLDEDNQKEIVDWLVGEGYQVVCEVVGKSFDGDSIIIEKK